MNTDEKDTGKKDEKKFEQDKNGLGECLNIKASILEKKSGFKLQYSLLLEPCLCKKRLGLK